MPTRITSPAPYSGPASYGTLALDFVDGEAVTSQQVNEGHRRYFRRRGFTVADIEDTTIAEAGQEADAEDTTVAEAAGDDSEDTTIAEAGGSLFDPDGHSVADVVAYLDAAPDAEERTRVLEAEAAGRDRAGIRNWTAPEED